MDTKIVRIFAKVKVPKDYEKEQVEEYLQDMLLDGEIINWES